MKWLREHKAVKACKRICELCALFLVVILLVSIGCYVGRWLEARRTLGTNLPELPKHEMAVTDSVGEKLKNVIERSQSERNKLPEVIKRAKSDVRCNIGELDNDDIAVRWNGLLGRYREDRAAAEGISTDQ